MRDQQENSNNTTARMTSASVIYPHILAQKGFRGREYQMDVELIEEYEQQDELYDTGMEEEIVFGSRVLDDMPRSFIRDRSPVEIYPRSYVPSDASPTCPYSPLHYACYIGDNNLTMSLLDDRADLLNQRDGHGNTPLILASLQGNVEEVNSLIDHGADINCQNYNGETALHIAANQGYLQIVTILLDHHAQMNLGTIEGATALHFATASGHHEIVATLLRYGSHLNAVDEEGDTPLHWGVREGQSHVVKLLVDLGADVNCMNEDGESPLDLAECLGEPQIHNILSTLRVEPQSLDCS